MKVYTVKTPSKKRRLKLSHILIAGCFLILLAGFAAVKIYLYKSATAPGFYPTSFPDNNWALKKTADNHQVEGFSSLASVSPGGNIKFQISCSAKLFNTSIYRMGWYGGNGSFYVANLGSRICKSLNIPSPDESTGLVNAGWPASVNLNIPQNWSPGMYLAKLTSSDGYQNYIPFTVRTSSPHSKYLFVHSINTDTAYNQWGGNSLYKGLTPALKLNRAVKVSLNRPYLMPQGGDDGSGDFLKWEYPMILFLEKEGYQVDYATDIDIHQHPGLLLKYKAIIITGHDEYWSKQMLDGYKQALARGVNLAVFAANTAYRPVRFEPDPLTGAPDRIMVNYKSAELDPFTKTNPQYSTPAGWQSPPLNEPESELLGDSYGGEIKGGATVTVGEPLVVYDDSSWIFKDTGLKKGDKIPGLVGYEYDKYIGRAPHPPGINVLFHSPFVNIAGKADFADSTYYQLPGGGQVFDAGTIEWSSGLNSSKSAYSPALVKITKNILDRFGGNQS
ncbi:MAG TPA: N,N-dimethylformamidase beta subunit family domain-containing protein [Candidatus Saccharimonadales bacterium]|nr:N,N-dimethylformamidase beta subunit family domain-containing protein [Candidatus Saccharimonadales bacterium]